MQIGLYLESYCWPILIILALFTKLKDVLNSKYFDETAIGISNFWKIDKHTSIRYQINLSFEYCATTFYYTHTGWIDNLFFWSRLITFYGGNINARQNVVKIKIQRIKCDTVYCPATLESWKFRNKTVDVSYAKTWALKLFCKLFGDYLPYKQWLQKLK